MQVECAVEGVNLSSRFIKSGRVDEKEDLQWNNDDLHEAIQLLLLYLEPITTLQVTSVLDCDKMMRRQGTPKLLARRAHI